MLSRKISAASTTPCIEGHFNHQMPAFTNAQLAGHAAQIGRPNLARDSTGNGEAESRSAFIGYTCKRNEEFCWRSHPELLLARPCCSSPPRSPRQRPPPAQTSPNFPPLRDPVIAPLRAYELERLWHYIVVISAPRRAYNYPQCLSCISRSFRINMTRPYTIL